jgi:hypothetical protein
MATIPDFNDAERWVVEIAPRERYGEQIPIELAEAEIRLESDTPCSQPARPSTGPRAVLLTPDEQ